MLGQGLMGFPDPADRTRNAVGYSGTGQLARPDNPS